MLRTAWEIGEVRWEYCGSIWL